MAAKTKALRVSFQGLKRKLEALPWGDAYAGKVDRRRPATIYRVLGNG